MRNAPPELAANTLLCLINQASYLLRRQLQRLEQDFLQHGGFTERLYAMRSQARQSPLSDSSDLSDRSDKSDNSSACPACGKPMILRTARQGARAGSRFWGCSAYPSCTATRPCAAPSGSRR